MGKSSKRHSKKSSAQIVGQLIGTAAANSPQKDVMKRLKKAGLTVEQMQSFLAPKGGAATGIVELTKSKKRRRPADTNEEDDMSLSDEGGKGVPPSKGSGDKADGEAEYGVFSFFFYPRLPRLFFYRRC
jgi:hypothetical protein